MQTSKVGPATTSADTLAAMADPVKRYSEAELKSVVALSVKLPRAARTQVQAQCVSEGVKLATLAKQWLVERFDIDPALVELIVTDNRMG